MPTDALPLVSVVMPVRNGEKYLQIAIDSIVRQTFADLELVVIDDGSTDTTPAILAGAAAGDKRVRVLTRPARGLVQALNLGIDEARGAYVARMDADDVSLPTRLERQVSVMERDAEIGLCGTWVETFGEGKPRIWPFPADSEGIRAALLFWCSMAHPTVMMRKAMLDAHSLRYDDDYPVAEDYDLWARATDLMRAVNIPEVLLHYRCYAGQASQSRSATSQASSNATRARLLAQLGIANPTPEEWAVHLAISTDTLTSGKAFIEAVHAWLTKLAAANRETGRYTAEAFSQLLGECWFDSCRASADTGLWCLRRYKSSPLSRNVVLPRTKLARFLLKCLLRRRNQRRR